MKIKMALLISVCGCSLCYAAVVFAGCPPTWTSSGTFKVCPERPEETRDWRIVWWDGSVVYKPNFALGQCCPLSGSCNGVMETPRSFPTSRGEEWAQTAYDRYCAGFSGCLNDGGPRTVTSTKRCRQTAGCNNCEFPDLQDSVLCLTTNNLEDTGCCSNYEAAECVTNGGVWDEPTCTCVSPIVIDVAGNGFNLTSAQTGVSFDILNTGSPKQIAWTSANSDDAWLALDRNENGKIDNGRELFGSSSPQPFLAEGETKNGFRALAVYDKAANGGNNDGRIDAQDAVFPKLKLWRDANHNGLSEANELKTTGESGLALIELDYSESKKQDEHGNWFRYRAKVKDAQGAQTGRWAWDVYLKVAQ